MYRTDLLQKLQHYRTRWSRENAVTDRLIRFVESHADCFERSLQIGHITGSAWLVNRAGTHVLLTHHKKLDRWLQLGGHADGETNILAAALREAREESGIPNLTSVSSDIFDLDIHRIPARHAEPEHNHHDIRFAFRCANDETYTVSDESHDLAWIEIDQLEHCTTEESMLRMARKWLNP